MLLNKNLYPSGKQVRSYIYGNILPILVYPQAILPILAIHVFIVTTKYTHIYPIYL
jgi:hypothetical protein